MFGVALCVSCEASTPPAPATPVAPASPTVASTPGQVSTALDTRGWARASDSAFAAGLRFHDVVEPSCHADHGCVAPAPIPSCTSVPEAKPVETLFDNTEKLEGERVVIRGKLLALAKITLQGCGRGCCNGAGGTIGMGSLRFVDRRRAKAFRCGGDDSILCCGFELPEVDVIASGIVYGDANYAELEDVALCAVREADDVLPNASFETEGCVVDGTLRQWNETFAYGDRRCACYGDRIYCRRDGCFHAGWWYERGMPRPLGRSCSRCVCDGEWKCERYACGFPMSSSFPTGSVQLDPREQIFVRDVGEALAERAPVDIELRGYGTAEEGKRALLLSRQRAEVVARELVRAGVPRSWITIRAMGAVADDPRRYGRVEVQMRDHELPRIDPPRPP